MVCQSVTLFGAYQLIMCDLKLSDIALTYPPKSLAILIKHFGPIVYVIVQTVTKSGMSKCDTVCSLPANNV